MESGYIRVSGGDSIYYEACGEGDALLFIHGYSLDRCMWDDQFQHFGHQYRTIRLDMRGFGLSPAEHDQWQYTYADDVVTAMDSLHIGKAALVGLSMGGFIVGDMIGVYPERLTAAVCACGTIVDSPGPGTPFTEQELARKRKNISTRARINKEEYKRSRVTSLLTYCHRNRDTIAPALERQIMEWSAYQAYNLQGRLYYGEEAFERLSVNQPALPVLFMYGERDTSTPSHEDRMRAFLPQSEVFVMPECGHMINMENPELFNERLAAFLKQAKEEPKQP